MINLKFRINVVSSYIYKEVVLTMNEQIETPFNYIKNI